VFLGGPDAPWQLLLNGLPAIASLPIYVSGNHWLIAMSNGGSYQSADFGKTWQRMDTDSEQGRITSVIPTKENSLSHPNRKAFFACLIPKNNRLLFPD